ncbi:MAG: hypothetical protein AB1817_01855 [Chloroflexota bacterium]
MNNSITQLGFLCLFNLIGGAAIGSVLRGVLRGRFSCNSIFFLIWGAGFGGMPLLFGIQELQKGAPYFLLVQFAVFVTAILVVAIISDELLATLRSPNIFTIAIGGVFLMLGAAMLFTNFFELKGWAEKLLGGGIFIVTGGAVFLIGLWRLIKS